VPVRDVAKAELTATAPAWLAGENPAWRGNHLVRYWDPEWQNIIFGSPTAYLDKILEAGFDGVYLDKIDANDDWQGQRPTAEREMVEFVKKLAAYARVRHPGFLIVPQNAEELLKHKDYVKTIDAIAKEDLLFGGGTRKDGEANPNAEINKSKKYLNIARRAGRKVLVVEYLSDLTTIVSAQKELLATGYIPFFARRALDEPPMLVPSEATAAAPETVIK
jgi:cysteinyl-tRNA synthetase, unknown class